MFGIVAKRLRLSGPHQPSLQSLNSDAALHPREKIKPVGSLPPTHTWTFCRKSMCGLEPVSTCELYQTRKVLRLFDTIGRVGWPSRPLAPIRKAAAHWASGPYRARSLRLSPESFVTGVISVRGIGILPMMSDLHGQDARATFCYPPCSKRPPNLTASKYC